MKIKAGTLGTWTKNSSKAYSVLPGAQAVVTKDFNSRKDEFIRIEWIRNELSGEQQNGGYFPSDFEFDVEPVYDVNKTVEISAPVSKLIDIIDIGKLLSVLPFNAENPLYTRPFIQDACYCAYGWAVDVTNDIINKAVKMDLFKLV